MKAVYGQLALDKLLREYAFDPVLDIGCGEGRHTAIFEKHGKAVTAIDCGQSASFKSRKGTAGVVVADFNTWQPGGPFDCVWASAVLEHQLNVNAFLRKVAAVTKDAGLICITVPPLKDSIVGGHVTLWNGGLLLYNLVLAGLDCKRARLKQYGYCISIILRKRAVELPPLAYDSGDIDRLAEFFPDGLHERFDGNIGELNWDAGGPENDRATEETIRP